MQEPLPLPTVDDTELQAELILEIPIIPAGLIDDPEETDLPEVASDEEQVSEEDSSLDDLVVDLAAYIEERESIRAKKDLPVLDDVVPLDRSEPELVLSIEPEPTEEENLSAEQQANVKINLAHIFADIGDLDEARTMLRDVVRSGPEDHRREAAELLQALG